MRDMTNGLRRHLRQTAKKLRPPRSVVYGIDLMIEVQLLRKKSAEVGLTPAERQRLAEAEAAFAELPPDDLLFQMLERQRTDPDYRRDGRIQHRLAELRADLDRRVAERDAKLAKREYGLKLLPVQSQNEE